MTIKLTFEITLRSNYHVGAGYGKGFNVDSALMRDANGAPVIRGSALAGLLRDGAYRLLQLAPLRKYSQKKTLTRIFGSAEQPKRWHISSAYPKAIPIKGRDAQAVQHVRIDPRTRRAASRQLFSREEGAGGQVFTFTIICQDNDETVLDEAAMLVAAARNVRQLGRSRRRGLGECIFHLSGIEGVSAQGVTDWQEWLLTRFKERWMDGNLVWPEDESGGESPKWATGEHPIARYAGTPVRFRLIVRLDEPLIIARRAPAGQQFEARESIPGTAILGALANNAANRQTLTDPENYAHFISLFIRGNVGFPILYPAEESEGDIFPTIPAPLGLLTCDVLPFQKQSKGHGLYLGVDGYQTCSHDNCPGKLRPIRDFLSLSDEPPYTYSVPKSSELHIQVNEETGRVAEGQLYGYTVLDADQYFVGELVCASEAAWQKLQEMTGIAEKTPLYWRLGKARRRGYGKVTAWLERCNDKEPVWIQIPLEERVTDVHQMLSLTLLTDTIVQNTWGQQVTGFSETWLQDALGLGKIKIEDAYARSCVVDSFNAHLGLPRWRDTALTAGSVVWFKLINPPDDWQERMKRLELEGLGLRRNEGFGRVAFNHPVYDQRHKLDESNIPLASPMTRKEKPQVDKFDRTWNKTLDSLLPEKMDPRFVTVARWLHAHKEQSPQKLLSWMRALGEPAQSLVDVIGGQQEYGARSKDNYFNTDGKDDFEKIRKVLEELRDKDKKLYQRGIEILADRIAALARSEKGETQ